VLRFADEKVHVLGHDDISGDVAAIPAADTFQFLFEGISSRDGVEHPHSLITAEGDEVQTVLVLISNWLDVHLPRL
jgi:hypothetical protein